ncbi:hypothetical protein [Nocardia carnea]|uniref:hypothetical protein n=1 Tax=Nocardia carnea TaxID=37328 RepID=UPI002457858D|nr:hypothetical protein [Nocardia carnea]
MTDIEPVDGYGRNLARLREELTVWGERIPSSTHGPTAHNHNPVCGHWWYLDKALSRYERGELPADVAMLALREQIVRNYDRDCVWSPSARRNQIVAAFNGTRWEYDAPRPVLMPIGPVQLNGADFPFRTEYERHFTDSGYTVSVSNVGRRSIDVGMRSAARWEIFVCLDDQLMFSTGIKFKAGVAKTHAEVAEAVAEYLSHAETIQRLNAWIAA